MATKKLTRSVDDRMLAGVCAGFADYLDVDPTVMRVAVIIGLLATGIFPLVALYFAFALVMPSEDLVKGKLDAPDDSDVSLKAA